jgi:hypothetical protein
MVAMIQIQRKRQWHGVVTWQWMSRNSGGKAQPSRCDQSRQSVTNVKTTQPMHDWSPLRLLLVAAVIGESRLRFQRQHAANNGHERNTKDGCRGQGDGLNDNCCVTAKRLALGCSLKVLGAATMMSMLCSGCNELQKQGMFLSVFPVVREKKPDMFLLDKRHVFLLVFMLKTFAVWRGQKGNRKGNSKFVSLVTWPKNGF